MLAEDRAREGLVPVALGPRQPQPGVLLAHEPLPGASPGRGSEPSQESQVESLDIRPPDLGVPVRRMSGGNQQKVVFGKWLLHGATVQILDEPTRGVDVATKVQIYRVIGGLADEGLAVLLISSELPEILGMSDRILVMREGTVVGELPRASATEERLLGIAAGVQGAAA